MLKVDYVMKALLLTLLDLVPGSLYFYGLKHSDSDRFGPSIVTRSTSFVIEGFPRCANTHSYYHLQLAFGTAKIAHHIHSWQQFLFAAILQKPAVRLIRHPDSAVASIQTKQNRNVSLAYLQYALFYSLTNFFPNKTVSFEDVVSPEGLEKLTDYIGERIGSKPLLVRPDDFQMLFASRTNHKNRPTPSPRLEEMSRLTQFFRIQAIRAYGKSVNVNKGSRIK